MLEEYCLIFHFSVSEETISSLFRRHIFPFFTFTIFFLETIEKDLKIVTEDKILIHGSSREKK